MNIEYAKRRKRKIREKPNDKSRSEKIKIFGTDGRIPVRMFSWSEGIPIAKVIGGEDHGQVLKLLETDPREDEKKVIENPGEELGKDFFSTRSRAITDKQFKILCKCLKERKLGSSEEEQKLEKKFEQGMDEIKHLESSTRNVVLQDLDSEFTVLPRKGEHMSLLIGGRSGSGKSTMAARFIKEYSKKYPHSEFFLFSQKEEDKALDSLHDIEGDPLIKRIKIDEKLIDDPIDMKEFPDGVVCIFDDVDVLPKELLHVIIKIRDQLVNMIRSRGGMVITVVHNFLQREATKNVLLEASDIVVFCKAGSNRNVEDVLKKHASLSSKEISKIIGLKSRWVWVKISAPQIVFYSSGAYFI